MSDGNVSFNDNLGNNKCTSDKESQVPIHVQFGLPSSIARKLSPQDAG